MKTHKDLDVWKLSMEMITEIYEKTSGFPKHEVYGLTSQIRRASISVAANISEGAGRRSSRELRQFLYISMASLSELETLMIVSSRIGYLNSADSVYFHEKIKLITAQLGGFIKSIERKISNQKVFQ